MGYPEKSSLDEVLGSCSPGQGIGVWGWGKGSLFIYVDDLNDFHLVASERGKCGVLWFFQTTYTHSPHDCRGVGSLTESNQAFWDEAGYLQSFWNPRAYWALNFSSNIGKVA